MSKKKAQLNNKETPSDIFNEKINTLLDQIDILRAEDKLTEASQLYGKIVKQAEEFNRNSPSSDTKNTLDFFTLFYQQFEEIVKLVDKQTENKKLSPNARTTLKEINSVAGYYVSKVSQATSEMDFQAARYYAKKGLKLFKLKDKISPTYETKFELSRLYQQLNYIYLQFFSIDKAKKAMEESIFYAKEAIKMYRCMDSLNLLAFSHQHTIAYDVSFDEKDSVYEADISEYIKTLRDLITQDKRNNLPLQIIKTLLNAGEHFYINLDLKKAVYYYEEALKEMENYMKSFKDSEIGVSDVYQSTKKTINRIKSGRKAN